MRSAFAKDIIRTIRANLKRFCAIVVITVLGAAMFSGLKASCDDLRASADAFFDEQRLFDLRVMSTLGLTDDDVAALAALDGVQLAEGGWVETTYTNAGGTHASVDVKALSPDGLNAPYVLSGELPDEPGEVAVTSSYLADAGASIGDTVRLDEADDEDSAVFERRDYRITAVVIDPMEVNNPDSSMSFRAASSSDYTFFVTQDDVVSDAYTVVYLLLDDADALQCYSDGYEQFVLRATDEVEAIRGEREQARTDEIIGDALAQVEDAEAEAQEGFDEAESAFADGQAELDDGRAQLADGQAEIDEGRATLERSQAEIDANRATLEQSQAQIDAGYAQLAAAQAEIDTNRATLADSRATLEQSQAALDAQKAQVEDARAQLEAARPLVQAQKDQINAEFDAQRAQLEAIGASEEELAALEAQRVAALAAVDNAFAEQEAQVEAAEAALAAGAAQLEDAWEQLTAGEAALAVGQAEIDANRSTLDASQKQIDAGWAQLESGQAQVDEGRAELDDGQAELDRNAADLESGQAELDDQRAEYEQTKADALAELADAREEVETLEGATWYIQDRTSLSGYSAIESDANSIEALGTAFPIIFLIVAILVSLTAITRLVEEDRGLVGVYKALGYRNRQIYAKYLVYALSACLIGGIVGDVFGFVGLPAFIFTVFDVMYVLPGYPFLFNPVSGTLGVLVFMVAIGGAAFIACRGEVRQAPAALMRPKAPRFGARILLERITPLWRKLSFLNKVTARNIFRYKKRFFMTVAGILGCTALIVCAFIIKDSVALMAPEQYESVDRYDVLAVVAPEDFDELRADFEADSRIGDVLPVHVDSGDARVGTEAVDVQIIVVPEGESLEGYISLADASAGLGTSSEGLALSEDGVILTFNAASVLGITTGDSFELQTSTLEKADVEVAGISESYLGNYAYLSESAYEKIFGALELNALLALAEDGADTAALADELSQDAMYLSVTSTSELEDSFEQSFALINAVVAVILVMAAALAFVVLFTLSTTNISERERELATIKVLGFRAGEVHHYVNKETLILTAIGIAFGLVAGPPLGELLLDSLNMPGIAFPVHVEWTSMLISATLPFVFALLVNLITNRTLDRIDMIGALKSVE